MFQTAILPGPSSPGAMSSLLDCLSQASSRPRYAFMVLSLIAEAADSSGEAGPFVQRGRQQMTLRDWLCDSLAPMGGRDPRRIALAERVKSDLILEDRMPQDPTEAAAAIEDEVRLRVRASGKTNLSRAVSELVEAGLVRRCYKGYAIDHENRGRQRHAVYVLQGMARCLLPQSRPVPPARRAIPVQGEFRFS
ncbi:hypothetical protein [Novosphingobium taihuense]|uniref:Uncharacterized protein n=1 Tax=Novosphingobium taihuense TaxID=260085 RepID=A0A7W7AE77_9SPHN|nr:hypothetical protein [Novosphingobium taihuense]MBB4615368.1 hypothetical protein [Novosphingobium taihuense]TWH82179.1 hypothetical protein IQ25_03332 [Novosphingobium taihuense]